MIHFMEKFMLQFLKQTFLFKEVDDDLLNRIVNDQDFTERKYKRGDLIYPSNDIGLDVGFILEGKCDVCRMHSDGSKTLFNTLLSGNSFGILSAFSNDDFPTQIFAETNTRVLYFSKNKILEYANNSSQISLNLIKFFAGRVAFLNQKLATLSGGTVESRLANYLINESKKTNDGIIHLNFKKTSDAINSGRASVYRAVDSLEDAGVISIIEKQIKIINYEELERISK